MTKLTLKEILEKYDKTFEGGFPTVPLAWGRTDAEVNEIVDNCIKNGKDVYEMGYVTDNPDVIY